MYVSKTSLRVHYAATDQMGVVYHGRYAEFFEIGRVEALRQLGISYKDIEKLGIIMPVTELHIRFIRPARYDDMLTIVTTLKEMPHNHKIIFHSEIFNESEDLLSAATVSLYFLDAKTMKKTDMPQVIRERLVKYFPED